MTQLECLFVYIDNTTVMLVYIDNTTVCVCTVAHIGSPWLFLMSKAEIQCRLRFPSVLFLFLSGNKLITTS